jgi:predicted transcriptional regulator YdeE
MEKIQRPVFRLVGLKLDRKTSNENGQSGIDCGNLWQIFEKEHFAERIPGKSGDVIYAVYFEYEGDYTKPFSYFIGCKVRENTQAPEGMTSLTIPDGNFSKLIAKGKMPDCVANAWKDIWNSNMNRAYQYDFEIYDQRSKDWSNAEVDIYVSTR